MATQIQNLFLVELGLTVTNGEDLSRGVAFRTVAGVDIPLDGILFTAIVRATRSPVSAPFLGLASAGATLVLPPSVPRGLFLTKAGSGVLGFYAPFTQLPQRPLPGSYVADVYAQGDGITRRIVDLTLNIIQGT